MLFRSDCVRLTRRNVRNRDRQPVRGRFERVAGLIAGKYHNVAATRAAIDGVVAATANYVYGVVTANTLNCNRNTTDDRDVVANIRARQDKLAVCMGYGDVAVAEAKDRKSVV